MFNPSVLRYSSFTAEVAVTNQRNKMTIYRLAITFPLNFKPVDFPTKNAALKFLDDFREMYNGAVEYKLDTVLPYLINWMPDAADLMIIQLLLGRGDKVGPIRFARMKSGSGLKEAKDWIDGYLADEYYKVPPSIPLHMSR